MPFRQYLEKEKRHADVRGDVSRLLLSDPDLPEFRSDDELRSYMMERYDRLHLSNAAALVWKLYLAHERKASRKHFRDLPGRDFESD